MTTAPSVYDLLLTGGTLLDPAQGINDRRDVAFKNGLVARVADRIDPASAATAIDVPGKLITPGLIDLHGHFYHGGNASGVPPDNICLASGTTTGVDAGSAGFEMTLDHARQAVHDFSDILTGDFGIFSNGVENLGF